MWFRGRIPSVTTNKRTYKTEDIWCAALSTVGYTRAFLEFALDETRQNAVNLNANVMLKLLRVVISYIKAAG